MHEKVSVNSLCFGPAKLSELPAAWRALGARRVTIVSPLIEAEGIAVAQAAVAQADVAVECIPHPFMDGQTLQSSEASWREPRERLRRAIEAAHQLGARSIELMTGARGDLDWEEAARRFIAATAPHVEEAQAAGVSILIEPTLPRHAGINMIHSLDQARRLAEMAGMGICLDFYGCWTDPALLTEIGRVAGRVGLVQVSDGVIGADGEQLRAVPGDGQMPLREIIAAILQTGYRGTFDLELLGPMIDKEGHLAAVRRSARMLGDMLSAEGL